MKLQLVFLATLFALVYTSPLPQAVEVKPAEPVSDAAAIATPEEPAPEVKNAAPTTVEPEADQPTELPATTEAAPAATDAVPEEKTASDEAAKKETNETPAIPVVQAGIVDDSPANAEDASAAVVASVDDVKESTAQVSADDVKEDTVKIADAVEPVAVASDEAARAVRTATDEEAEKKEAVQDDVAVTTEVPAEVKAADETASAASLDDKPAAEAKTELPTTTVATATLSAVTTQPAKADSSEESKESQESDEKP